MSGRWIRAGNAIWTTEDGGIRWMRRVFRWSVTVIRHASQSRPGAEIAAMFAI
jgi:hypothetical protein